MDALLEARFRDRRHEINLETGARQRVTLFMEDARIVVRMDRGQVCDTHAGRTRGRGAQSRGRNRLRWFGDREGSRP
jgi:hypothetical protein